MSSSPRKILVLGSGMVAPPCLEYLSRSPRNRITLGKKHPPSHALSQNANFSKHAEPSPPRKLATNFPNIQAISLDVTSQADLDKHIAQHDIVISLIPYIYHVAVIKSAIKSGTNVVTTSYVSDSIRALDAETKLAGITVLNEVGVDPGIDHVYAVKRISEIHAGGGKVLEFYSYCGGLPAPECADNPLGFKFSWSPRGALLSQRNSARFLRNGVVEEVSSNKLMASAVPYHVVDRYDFVAYANRDSVPFREFYGIPEAHTVIRGSLRYEGNPGFVQALANLGWLEQEKKEWLKEGMTWAEIQQKAIGASLITRIKELARFPSAAESERIISGMKWMGLLSSEKATVKGGNLLDTLCEQLEKLMSFRPGERDLVMLQHKFVVEWEDGTMETFTSTLELLGDPNRYSAMALSVGVTCGIATQLLIDRHPAVRKLGVHAPYTTDICDVLRERVEKEGVRVVEQKV
ncbi:Saccharopine dehydrogenase [Lophiostoma macrostomum CBS 122681]|uniref:Saccharopine dehydrogenase n=1 Tax=Lophiostoma macrostomum CBS 122681 TaxID=1314788 RepID=A0A6A6SHY3_9PLEO|nr:Saccharopine dehydrogenase [Lophiostoma macrostomum CBS 122681]